MEIDPLSGALGAKVTGVRLDGLDDVEFQRLSAALWTHGVLIIPEQRLAPGAHVALAQRFGTPNIHPMMRTLDGFPEILEVLKGPEDRNNFGGDWHTDLSFLERPASVSILQALDVPPVGGDTLFASMARAYDGLSSGLQSALSSLRAVHTSAKVYYPSAQVDGIIGNAATMTRTKRDDEQGTAVHPVIRTHPETGRKVLYVNEVFTTRFDGMTETESEGLLRYLWRFATRPEFTCRIQWAKGSVAMWDNRSVQHYALNDYQGHRRLMHRIAVEGERPS